MIHDDSCADLCGSVWICACLACHHWNNCMCFFVFRSCRCGGCAATSNSWFTTFCGRTTRNKSSPFSQKAMLATWKSCSQESRSWRCWSLWCIVVSCSQLLTHVKFHILTDSEYLIFNIYRTSNMEAASALLSGKIQRRVHSQVQSMAAWPWKTVSTTSFPMFFWRNTETIWDSWDRSPQCVCEASIEAELGLSTWTSWTTRHGHGTTCFNGFNLNSRWTNGDKAWPWRILGLWPSQASRQGTRRQKPSEIMA